MHIRRSTVLSLLLSALFAAPQAATPAPESAPTPPAAAVDGPVYNIEILIFRTTSTPTGEDFSAEPPIRGGTDADASGGNRAGRFVEEIPAARFQLDDVEAKLKAAAGYQPIAHVAWSQTASAFGTRAGFTLQKLGINVPGLEGLVYLERGQFLHLGMALAYSPAAGGPPTYRLNELRRIRFYEKNYYDHPAFGVIALVTPAQGARGPGR